MGVIVHKETEKRTELNDRVSTSLRERASQTSGRDTTETDFVDKSEYGKDLRKSGRFAWVWFVLVLLAVVSLIIIFMI